MVCLLESAGPDFDDKGVESYLVSALFAARSALNITTRHEKKADEPDRR